jgi:hypothetical protein
MKMEIPNIERLIKIIMNTSSAYDVKRIPMKTINSFSIIPRVYEKELDDKYGIILSELKNGRESGFKGDLEKNVSFNGGFYHSTRKINNKILKKYKSIPGFCSMIVENEEELMEHVKNIHELSYNHYVFGKGSGMENLRGRFPNFCCSPSSKNNLLNMMEKGYPNASFFYSSHGGHAYNGLPFLFGKNQEKGFIVVDPTSDQLFKDKESPPRNNLFVVSGDKWEYKTDWANGNDLFPGLKDYSGFSNLNTLRNIPNSEIHVSMDINKYFEEVFKNPVKVDVRSF